MTDRETHITAVLERRGWLVSWKGGTAERWASISKHVGSKNVRLEVMSIGQFSSLNAVGTPGWIMAQLQQVQEAFSTANEQRGE